MTGDHYTGTSPPRHPPAEDVHASPCRPDHTLRARDHCRHAAPVAAAAVAVGGVLAVRRSLSRRLGAAAPVDRGGQRLAPARRPARRLLGRRHPRGDRGAETGSDDAARVRPRRAHPRRARRPTHPVRRHRRLAARAGDARELAAEPDALRVGAERRRAQPHGDGERAGAGAHAARDREAARRARLPRARTHQRREPAAAVRRARRRHDAWGERDAPGRPPRGVRERAERGAPRLAACGRARGRTARRRIRRLSRARRHPDRARELRAGRTLRRAAIPRRRVDRHAARHAPRARRPRADGVAAAVP